MNFKYIGDLLNCLLTSTLSIFCGAGSNADATNAEWKNLFGEKTQNYYDKNICKDLYLLSDLEKRYYNKDFLKNIKQKIYKYNNSNSIHLNNIIKLNLNQIWTTNFDNMIENTIEKTHGFKPIVIKDSIDILTEDISSKYVVYKLNGCISNVKTMILTKTDFEQYLKKQRILFEILKRQLVINSFLFIGYSFSDELVLSALREIKEILPTKSKIHYRFVLKKNDNENKEFVKYESKYYKEKYNIKSIYINDFNEIDVYLKELYNKYCEHNVLITGSYRNIDNDHRHYLEDLINSIIDKLYLKNYNIISGNGRGIGEMVLAAYEKSKSNTKSNKKSELINRPLIFSNESNEEKSRKNKIICADSKVNIIICGQDNDLKSSKNVKNQAKLFLDKDYLLIPIPSSQYAAKEIFESPEFKNSIFYLNNKKDFENLSQTNDINEISTIIINLILKAFNNE